MNTPFHYVRVSEKFIRQELADRVLRGESAVLLGHPNSGKGYVCRSLVEHLRDDLRGRLVRVDFDFGDVVTTADEFMRKLQHAVIEAGGAEVRQGSTLLEALDTLRVRQPLLIANNVDSVAHHVARRFLQEVRVRVEEGRLVVILTGEYDLQDLVHGPNSEFNTAGQYVLQGFELDEFTRFVERHPVTYGITWDPPEESMRRLWEITGGNLDVTREILGGGMDLRFREGTPGCEPWRTGWIEEKLANRDVASRFYRRILQHAVRLIPTHPNSWPNLKKLIAGEPAMLRAPMGTPGPLTLSGLATRQEGQLHFSSELMARATREHYCDQRLGDLYASVGHWPEAVEHYKRTDPEQRLRPVTALDRIPTDRILRTLRDYMHAAAVEGVEAVRKLFSDGCRYVFGFPEVVFWRRITRWDPVETDAETLSREAVVAGREILTEAGPRPGEELSISQPWEEAVLGARLKGLWNDQPSAVLVGDFRGKRLLSQERQRLAQETLQAFRHAYDHAMDLQRERQLLRFRQTFEQITREIVEALGSQILDVDGVLRSAATGLRSLGYRRVFFSLVDPAELNINGVWDESDDPKINLPAMNSSWPLAEPTADVQSFVVSTKKYLLVEDATSHPLTCKPTIEKAGMRGLALIPLCTGPGRVLGTLHIERRDRSPISEEEAREFFEFGRTLAALIEQGERIHLMQSALDHQLEPLLIVDACNRVRYGNEPASRLFPTLIPGRWRTAIGGAAFSELSSVSADLALALKGNRVSHHVDGVGAAPEYRGSILAEPILNRREEIAGAFIHIQDLNYFFRVLNALGEAASAKDVTSCTERLLEATRILGHKWGRLFLLNQATGELVSKSQFGFPEGSPEALEYARIRLAPRGNSKGETWCCIEEKKPFVFCFSGEDGDLFTKTGLPVMTLSNSDCSGVVRKQLAEYWIDLPLLAGSNAVGKISLECKADLQPEHLEFLKVLVQTASVILEGFTAREDSIRIEEAERSLAKLSHMIGTKYAWLWPALSGYKRLEDQYPQLAQRNASFEQDLRDLDEVLSRAKEMLRGIVLSPTEFDVVSMLRGCMAGIPATLDAPQELEVRADELLLGSAVKEILENSLKAQRNLSEPAIRVSVALVEKTGAEWVRVIITDSGPGVPLEYKEKIFDDFFTYDPHGQLGTGLGLGLVRRVIRAHHGAVGEVGELGEGARFELEIPRYAATPSVEQNEDAYV